MKLSSQRLTFGFTITEIIVTLTVFSVILAITWGGVSSYLIFSRDGERTSDISSIARSMEYYYRSQASSGVSPSYPTVTQINTSAQRATIIPDSDDRLYAPGMQTVSLSAATTTTQPVPNKSQYIYQPFTESGGICTAAADTPCVRFMLYYFKEQSNSVQSAESSHQQ